MNIGAWVVIGFLAGFSVGIAAGRVGLWLRAMRQKQEEIQAPPRDASEIDPDYFLPPFPRLRPPPR